MRLLVPKLASDRVQNIEWSLAQDLSANTFKAKNILLKKPDKSKDNKDVNRISVRGAVIEGL